MPQTKSRSQNGVAGFLFTPSWEWVRFPAVELVGDDAPMAAVTSDARYSGFAVEVLTNLSGAKEREHELALRAYTAGLRRSRERLQAAREMSGAEESVREAEAAANDAEAAEDAYLGSIGWRCRAWNWQEENVAGEAVAVPAPGETAKDDAHAAFFVLPAPLRTWLVRVITSAVRPKWMTPPSSNASPTDITTLRSTPPEPRRPGS